MGDKEYTLIVRDVSSRTGVRRTCSPARLVAAMALLVIAGAAFAQSTANFRLIVGPVGNEIRLRWGGTESYPAAGYTVERKDGGDWKQIAGPLKIETDPAKLRQILGQDLDEILKRMQVKTVDELGPALKEDPFWAQVVGMQFPQLAVALGAWHVDKDVQPGVAYSYRIRGGATVYATEVGITLGKELIVTRPVGLMASQLKEGVALQWPKVEARGIAGSAVYRAESESGPFTRLNRVLVQQPFVSFQIEGKESRPRQLFVNYLDANPDDGKTYYYRVVSVDMLGAESAPSNTVFVTVKDITPPDMPQNVKTALQERKHVVVTWDASPSTDVAGYRILRGPTLDKLEANLTTQMLGAEVRSFTDESPPVSAFSWYVVIAVDKSGNESQKLAGASVYIPTTIPPAAPTGVAVSLKERSVELTWAANKETNIRGYRVYRGDSEKGEFVCVTSIPLTEPRFSEALPTDLEGAIWYQVSALDNDENESPRSAPVKLVLPTVRPPDAPQVLFARGDADGTVTVKWAPGISPDLAGWILERSQSTAPDAKWEALNGDKPFAKDVTEFKDTQVAPGNEYFYRVTAVGSTGLKTAPSEPAGAVVRKTTPPPPPKGVTTRVEPGVRGVIVAWDAGTEKDLAYYRVYRTGSAAGPWNPVVLSVPLDAPIVLDATAEAGATYLYRVTVFDTSGNESDPSESASVKVE